MDTLFAAGVCPSHIAITVDRNVISGDLQGYHEVYTFKVTNYIIIAVYFLG